MALLEFVTLAPLAREPARVLSGGQRKLLELARVLMADPTMLLLDEPAAGVNPSLLELIIDRIAGHPGARHHGPADRAQHGHGGAALLAASWSWPQGRLLAEGTPDAVARDPARRSRPISAAPPHERRPGPMLAAERPRRRLRAGPADRATAPRSSVARGRDRGRARAERRRQDRRSIKAIAGLVPIARRHACASAAPTSPGVPAHSMLRHGLAFVPQTENVFATLTVARQPAARRRPARRQRQARAQRIDAMFDAFPGPRAPAAAPGRPPVGRTAPDAGHRPRPDRRARGADARRASAGLSPKLVDEVFASLAGDPRRPASPSCWSSRTCAPRSPSPTAPWSWSKAATGTKARAAELARRSAHRRALPRRPARREAAP